MTYKEKVLSLLEEKEIEVENAFVDSKNALEIAAARKLEAFPRYAIGDFADLTMLSGGINEKGFTIICGPTGAGKTTLLANLWFQFIKDRKKVLVYSLEVGKDDFVDSCLSVVLGKSRDILTVDDYSNEQAKKTIFNSALGLFSVRDNRVNHINLLTEIYYSYLLKGINIVFIDNWNFMLEPVSGEDNIANYDRTLHDFITFTKKVPVHIFMVMHPKKKDDGRVTNVFDIKGSSTGVQESTNVWLFNHIETPMHSPSGVAPTLCRELKIGKARYNGMCTGMKVYFKKTNNSERYEEYQL